MRQVPLLLLLPLAAGKAIRVVGLGPGGAQHITRSAWAAIEACPRLFLRTSQHPAVDDLPCAQSTSFDELYERCESFSQVYEEICDILIAQARETDVLYAVPGDPCVGERTTAMLRERCLESDIDLQAKLSQPSIREKHRSNPSSRVLQHRSSRLCHSWSLLSLCCGVIYSHVPLWWMLSKSLRAITRPSVPAAEGLSFAKCTTEISPRRSSSA